MRRLRRWLLSAAWLSYGAHSEAAKKEVLVKEVVLDSAVADLVYLGVNHECALVTTRNKRLYYSQDAGQNWLEITARIDPDPEAVLQIERVIVSPTDKSVGVLQTERTAKQPGEEAPTTFPYVYVTEDSGKTWRRAWGKHQGLHSWIPHPDRRTWALVSWWSGDCLAGLEGAAPQAKGADQAERSEADRRPCIHNLMLTTDLGRSFTRIAGYVVQFSWGAQPSGQASRIYFTSYRSGKGDQGRLSLWTQEVDFRYVDISDRGRPVGPGPAEMVRHGNKFLVSNEYLLVAKVKNEAVQTVSLMVSKDGGRSFKAAVLPSGIGELEERWYTVLDTSEGAVMLHINSPETDGSSTVGRVYVSNQDGNEFSQSLVNNIRTSKGECEFDKIVSLTGVYMANVVVPNGASKEADQTLQSGKVKAEEELETAASGGAETNRAHNRAGSQGWTPTRRSKDERTVRTVISFDKGGVWNYLKPPKIDSLGNAYPCTGGPIEECSLHLHGTTSWNTFAPFYSVETALAIIMGTGNVGRSLRSEPSEVHTFLSRDGGLTWMEAHKSAYIYEFGDHGGLIVMADDLKKTAQVVFSWDEGHTWFDFMVSSTPFEVDNMISEPNLTSTTFLMFGTRPEGVGVLYYLKFDSLGFPPCSGVYAAGSVSSDYETWSPSDGLGLGGDKCLLGQQVTYTRRKATSQCWNGEKFERPVVVKRCQCTQADYMCDTGFVRPVGATDCSYAGTDMLPKRLIPTICSGTFTLSAYRKVAGDRCEWGFQPSPVEVPCPSRLNVSHMKILMLAAFLVAALCAAYNHLFVAKARFGEYSAPAPSPFAEFSVAGLLQLPVAALTWLYSRCLGGSRGFGSYGGLSYQKVGQDEFDMNTAMGGADDSLTDFIDEAEFDDHAPRLYDGSAAERRIERTVPVSEGYAQATAPVPRLQAPTGSVLIEEFSTAQDDLL